MNLHWGCVFIATIFEVLWVIGLKHSQSSVAWGATLLAIAMTFILLSIANQKLPIGTTYTVFTGIGTVGTVVCGMLFFGESFSLIKSVFIMTLFIGVLGLKFVTKEPEGEAQRVSVS